MLILLLFAPLFGGLFTTMVFWFWQRDLTFALLLAPIGASFATLLAAAMLAAVRSSSVRAFFASRSRRWLEEHGWTAS